MALHDGNGWVQCRCGLRHWGLHGAAGLLLLDGPGPVADLRVLLQLRAGWTHVGGTWGLPGGARDSHEDVVAAALREAEEEVGVGVSDVDVLAEVPGVDHGDWSYTYIVAVSRGDVGVEIRTQETDEVRWVALDGVEDLPLHPGLASSWADLRRSVEQTIAPGLR